jgi:hypothetical protein
MTYYQQIRIKKCFLNKPLHGVSVEFLFRKNLPDTILIFRRHFGLVFFPISIFHTNHFAERKNLYSLIHRLDFAAILKDF